MKESSSTSASSRPGSLYSPKTHATGCRSRGISSTATRSRNILDKHRLLCGSSLEPVSFLTLMDGKQARVVFEDAPYNTRVAGKISGLGKVKHREFVMGSGEMSDSRFTGFLTTNLQCIIPHIAEGERYASGGDRLAGLR